MPHRFLTTPSACSLLLLLQLLVLQPGFAVTFTFTGVSGTENWSNGPSWNAPPSSASDTILTYSGLLGDGAVVGSNNDVADPFTLNRINFNYEGPGSGTVPEVTITGGDLNFVVNGATNPVISIVPIDKAVDPNFTITNDIVLSNNLSVDYRISSLTLSGQISGTGTLIFTSGQETSNPTAILSNTANDWSGGLRINKDGNTSGGSRTVRLAASNVIPNGAGAGNVTLATTGEGSHTARLQLNGLNETINGLVATYGANMRNKDFNRVVENGGADNSTLTLGDDNATASYLGRIQDGAGGGTLGIDKIGTGIQTFAGRSAHTGPTTVTAGKIEIDYTQFGSTQTSDPADYFSANSALVLNGGSTFAIKGRTDGLALTDTVNTFQYANSITVSSQAIADQLVVGQQLSLVRADGSVGTFFVTGIVGTTIHTENRTGGGKNQTATLTTSATTGTTDQNLLSLRLSGDVGTNHTIDFGLSDTVVLTINAAPIQDNDGSLLTIANWSGLLGTGGGDERLMFAGEPNDFISIFGQSEVNFEDYGTGYSLIDGSGIYEVIPLPEPGSLALALLGGLPFLARRRRR